MNRTPLLMSVVAFFGIMSDCFSQSLVSGKIAYTKYASGYWSIWVINADGTHSTHLVDCLQSECYPSWSPDGTKIVFQRAVADGVGTFVINADGSNMTRLTPLPATGYSGDIRPSWTPDGRIVFNHVVNFSVVPPLTDIMIMNADGTGAYTVLASNGDSNLEPRMSPDGKKIVFMSQHNSPTAWQIFTVNADGTNLKQLTNEAANHGDPVWSPDGTKISFGSDREGGGKVNIFTVNADGSNLQQITHFNPPYEAGDNSWTSDGKYMAFEWDVNGSKQSDPNARAEVWIVPADGSRQPWSTGAGCASVGCAPRMPP
jgi:Tol biopolymer transport system component